MRCKCCDSSNNVQFWKDDWYCYPCRRAIRSAIKDDKIIFGGEEDNDVG